MSPRCWRRCGRHRAGRRGRDLQRHDFDLPLLETRFILARRRCPPSWPHLDLIKPSRRMWTSCFADCRLATLEREVIGVEREETSPAA